MFHSTSSMHFTAMTQGNRRNFMQRMSGGLCGAALAQLLHQDGVRTRGLFAADSSVSDANDLRPRQPHFEPKAKSVIHLFMNGGPSQMDLFDPKPVLDQRHGQTYFDKIAGEVESPQSAGALMRSPFKFAQHGESGMWVSDAMPHLAKQTDDLALIRSMFTTNLTHEPAVYLIQTGKMGPGRPTLGAWVVYGLGSECHNLPAYVVLDDPLGLPVNGVENWHSGFLPPIFQGTRFRSTGSPVLNLRPDVERPAEVVRTERALLSRLDQIHLQDRPGQSILDARIASYELAARMQIAASDALDMGNETQATQEMYGLNDKRCGTVARQCLLARRLVERGVRFVQIYSGGAHNDDNWDAHGDLKNNHDLHAGETDQPIAALLTDLKARGLLDSTLIVWGGEFGRQPTAEYEKGTGRDHNAYGFTMWAAGGGVKGGISIGTTDELGSAAVEKPFHVKHLHATMLNQLGLDPDRLTYFYGGLDQKLVGVEGAEPIREIMG